MVHEKSFFALNSVWSVFLLLVLAHISTASLIAAPIYAAKWKKIDWVNNSDQVVCVYGDMHLTHEILIEKTDERDLLDQFLQTLNSSQEEVLLLTEKDGGDVFVCEGKFEERWIEGNIGESGFLTGLSNYETQYVYANLKNREGGFKNLVIESIDERHRFSLRLNLLCKYQKLHAARMSDPSLKFDDLFPDQEDQALHAMGGKTTLMTLLVNPVSILRGLIETTNDRETGLILLRLKEVILNRMATFFRAFRLFGYELGDYAHLTLRDLYEKTTPEAKKENQKVWLPHQWLLNALSNFLLWNIYYMPDVVEARALWRIAHSLGSHKKVVVYAGDGHIAQIEKYLQELGYERIAQEGEVNRLMWQQHEKNRIVQCKKLIPQEQKLFGDLNDLFCLNLHFDFTNCTSKICEELVQETIEELKQDDCKLKFELVSTKTFNWINED